MTLKSRVENRLDEIELKKEDKMRVLLEKIERLESDKKELKAKWASSAKQLEKLTEGKKHEPK